MESDLLEDSASTGGRERGYPHAEPVNRELRSLTPILSCRSRAAHLPVVGAPSTSASAASLLWQERPYHRVSDLLQFNVGLSPVEIAHASGANTASTMAFLSALVIRLRPSHRSRIGSSCSRVKISA